MCQSKNSSSKQLKECKIQSRNTDRAEQTATMSRPYEDPALSDDAVNTDSVSSLKPLMNIADCDIGQWCALLYKGRIYPDKILSKTDSMNPTIEEQAMTKAGINKFKWPTRKDIDDYESYLSQKQ